MIYYAVRLYRNFRSLFDLANIAEATINSCHDTHQRRWIGSGSPDPTLRLVWNRKAQHLEFSFGHYIDGVHSKVFEILATPDKVQDQPVVIMNQVSIAGKVDENIERGWRRSIAMADLMAKHITSAQKLAIEAKDLEQAHSCVVAIDSRKAQVTSALRATQEALMNVNDLVAALPSGDALAFLPARSARPKHNAVVAKVLHLRPPA